MTRKLNGLPHNIADSFFSTLKFYDKGYMADWLMNAAEQFKVTDVTLDVLNATVTPASMNIKPLRRTLPSLRYVIDSELTANGLSKDFITEAKMFVHFDDSSFKQRLFYCKTIVKDREGQQYESTHPYGPTEPKFDASRSSSVILNRIKSTYKLYRGLVITTGILFILPFLFYSIERLLGVLPAPDVWWTLGMNHGPWRQESDAGGRGLGFEEILVGYTMLFMIVITLVAAVSKGIRNKSWWIFVLGCLLAVLQFCLGVLQVFLLIYPID
jgi:hypothetical protein